MNKLSVFSRSISQLDKFVPWQCFMVQITELKCLDNDVHDDKSMLIDAKDILKLKMFSSIIYGMFCPASFA